MPPKGLVRGLALAKKTPSATNPDSEVSLLQLQQQQRNQVALAHNRAAPAVAPAQAPAPKRVGAPPKQNGSLKSPPKTSGAAAAASGLSAASNNNNNNNSLTGIAIQGKAPTAAVLSDPQQQQQQQQQTSGSFSSPIGRAPVFKLAPPLPPPSAPSPPSPSSSSSSVSPPKAQQQQQSAVRTAQTPVASSRLPPPPSFLSIQATGLSTKLTKETAPADVSKGKGDDDEITESVNAVMSSLRTLAAAGSKSGVAVSQFGAARGGAAAAASQSLARRSSSKSETMTTGPGPTSYTVDECEEGVEVEQ